jgi:prophage tail gpP-like protein
MSGTDPNAVSIKVGTQTVSGWQDVRITRALESCPSSFDLGLTLYQPATATSIGIVPGDPCTIMVGSDTVLTGYVDRYYQRASADQHEIRVTGRGMCQDMVDCSARFQTMQLNNLTLVGVAKKLSQASGIAVKNPDGDSGNVPQFNVILTETPYEILERIASWANFLIYENADGSLNIAKVGSTQMASGFTEGKNIQSEEVTLSVDERYTNMSAVYLSTAFLNDNSIPAAGSNEPPIPIIGGAIATDTSFPKMTNGQPRTRNLIILSEQTSNLPTLAQQRVQWDMARRVGRSQRVNVTCDSWRDSAGTLWAINSLATINMPMLGLTNKTWLISEVTFLRNSDGTTADVTLMPKTAFVPEPTILQPYDFQVGQELPNGSNNIGPVAR